MMVDLLTAGSLLATVPAAAGLVQATAGWWAVHRFGRVVRAPGLHAPAVTILKPLHGDEPLLEQALASFCSQDYGEFQIVWGLQDPSDPALHVIRRLRARFPQVDMAFVVNPAQHGVNRKISNLINMVEFAKHDVIVIADSDIHAEPRYLQKVVAALGQPGVGLVTTLYAGLGASRSLAARLGTAQITHSFLPGALLARWLGRQDCLGATMALTRQTLEEIGGLPSLVHHLADDAVLGRLVAATGKVVALAATVPATTVPEQRLGDLFAHELRWARTIKSVAPVGFVLSSLQYPLFWAILAMALSGFEPWAVTAFAGVWLVRALASCGIDAALGLATVVPIWLLPIRDLLSVMVILASYGGRKVAWRGHVLRTSSMSLVPGKG